MRLLASVPVYLLAAILSFYALILGLKAILDTINGTADETFLLALAIILAVMGVGCWKLAPRIRGTS